MDISIISALQQRFGTGVLTDWRINRQPMYDRAAYPAAGTQNLRLMSVPLGAADPVSGLAKTYEQTNFKQSGQIDGQTFYAMRSVRTYLILNPLSRQPAAIRDDADGLYTTFPDMMSKFAEMYRRGVLTISFGETLWYQHERPFVELPAGFGLKFQQYAGTVTGVPPAQRMWTNAPARALDVWSSSDPVIIEPTQTISCSFDWPDGLSPVFTNLVSGASPAFTVGLEFDGYLIRTAQ